MLGVGTFTVTGQQRLQNAAVAVEEAAHVSVCVGGRVFHILSFRIGVTKCGNVDSSLYLAAV